MISGGIKENVLPTQVKATVNIRLLPGDTLDSVVDYLHRVIDDNNMQIEILSANDASPLSDHKAPQFTHLAQTIVDVYSNPSLKVVPYLTMGGTDSKHFNDLSDQVYRFSFMHMEKGDTDRIHGVDERISITGYYDMVQFYIHLFAGE